MKDQKTSRAEQYKMNSSKIQVKQKLHLELRVSCHHLDQEAVKCEINAIESQIRLLQKENLDIKDALSIEELKQLIKEQEGYV